MIVRAAGFDPVSTADPVDSLSPREREVYALLCDGLSNGEIAQRLFITQGTVKVHVHHVFDKLGVRSQDCSRHQRRASSGRAVRRSFLR